MIDADINISNISFTDLCYVKFGICMLLDEIGDIKALITQHGQTVEASSSASTLTNSSNNNNNNKGFKNKGNSSIELTPTIKIYLEPITAKKFS